MYKQYISLNSYPSSVLQCFKHSVWKASLFTRLHARKYIINKNIKYTYEQSEKNCCFSKKIESPEAFTHNQVCVGTNVKFVSASGLSGHAEYLKYDKLTRNTLT